MIECLPITLKLLYLDLTETCSETERNVSGNMRDVSGSKVDVAECKRDMEECQGNVSGVQEGN